MSKLLEGKTALDGLKHYRCRGREHAVYPAQSGEWKAFAGE